MHLLFQFLGDSSGRVWLGPLPSGSHGYDKSAARLVQALLEKTSLPWHRSHFLVTLLLQALGFCCLLTGVILQQGLLPHSHLLSQAPRKAFSFIRLVQYKLQIDNPPSLPQSIGQSQGTGPGCPQGEGMNTSRGGIRGGLITISLPVPKQTRPWYRKTTMRKKKERKQKLFRRHILLAFLYKDHV